jgi:hypothetical protein
MKGTTTEQKMEFLNQDEDFEKYQVHKQGLFLVVIGDIIIL